MSSDRPHLITLTPVTPATRDEIDGYEESVRRLTGMPSRQPAPHVHSYDKATRHPSGVVVFACECGKASL